MKDALFKLAGEAVLGFLETFRRLLLVAGVLLIVGVVALLWRVLQ